ncbi:hypothetical protein OCH239_02755 [Roseivivax halodurans JCM 10272]|uniref:Phosphatidate cytidylyltransferase n=1 Tax=Roseivivax halodurans JCM 10272 TaxID=1449350 RepID=X7EF66_9RHOB|nr:hypothetical protein [Roseivivax halodurans]ETX14577.1 hypothetical protein OCH239_02755 [Roseivivax halodurans JCM 10272]
MRQTIPPPRPTRAAALLAAMLLSLPFALIALGELAWWLLAGG